MTHASVSKFRAPSSELPASVSQLRAPSDTPRLEAGMLEAGDWRLEAGAGFEEPTNPLAPSSHPFFFVSQESQK